jgi:hypothetical protein
MKELYRIITEEIEEDWIALWELVSVTQKIFIQKGIHELNNKIIEIRKVIVELLISKKARFYRC